MNKGEKGQFTGGTKTEPPVAPPTLADMGRGAFGVLNTAMAHFMGVSDFLL